MTQQKVWLRFEITKKNGSRLKLRIQDLAREQIDEVISLLIQQFGKEEVLHKAVGLTEDPLFREGYSKYLNMVLHDPSCRVIICCADAPGAQDIVAVEVMVLETSSSFTLGILADYIPGGGTENSNKFLSLMRDLYGHFDLLKELNVSSYYRTRFLLVLPEYRGHRITVQLLTVCRLMCAADGVALVASWMSARGSQAAAERAGYATVAEVRLDALGRAHGVRFADAPPCVKLAVAGPLEDKDTVVTDSDKVDQ